MMMNEEIKQLISDVQYNCHISDAGHAGDYTLCIYLLKMREYYRWEQRLPFSRTLSREKIGDWLTERETLWEDLENASFRPLVFAGQSFAAFEAPALNTLLEAHRLIYSAGYGVKSKPVFFLAELEKSHRHQDFHIYIAGREYARDLTSPVAMSQGRNIFIRRESFRRMLWERLDEWRWNRPDNAMANAFACYDFDRRLEHALDAMTDNEIDNAILHEIGEIEAGKRLPGWPEMMQKITFTPAEIMARAVRDHCADTLHTLPEMLSNDNREQLHKEASIHFYFANLTNMRKHLFPSLTDCYRQWLQDKNDARILDLVHRAAPHWLQVARTIVEYGRQAKPHKTIADWVETQHL